MKTINDLDSNKSLGGVKFKHPETGETCIWHSQWEKGVWYKKDLTSNQLFIIHLENLTDSLKFEVIESTVNSNLIQDVFTPQPWGLDFDLTGVCPISYKKT